MGGAGQMAVSHRERAVAPKKVFGAEGMTEEDGTFAAFEHMFFEGERTVACPAKWTLAGMKPRRAPLSLPKLLAYSGRAELHGLFRGSLSGFRLRSGLLDPAAADVLPGEPRRKIAAVVRR